MVVASHYALKFMGTFGQFAGTLLVVMVKPVFLMSLVCMMMFQPFQSITLRFELLLEAQIMSWSTIKLPLTVNEKSHAFNPYCQISGHEQVSIETVYENPFIFFFKIGS